MIGAISQLIGKLTVGRKLALIYFLDLSAVIFISGILINEKYIAIDFSRKELAGANGRTCGRRRAHRCGAGALRQRHG